MSLKPNVIISIITLRIIVTYILFNKGMNILKADIDPISEPKNILLTFIYLLKTKLTEFSIKKS